MHPDWQTHLAQHTSPLADSGAALSNTVLCDLSAQGLIAVSGADALSFLQGQFTNDVRQVTPERSQLSAYCSPKGRMLASFRLFSRGNAYYLRLPAERVEFVLKRLRLYVLRAQVTLSRADNTLAVLGLAGPQAAAWLTTVLGIAPETVDSATEAQGITVLRIPGEPARFELYGEPAALIPVWDALAAKATPMTADGWRLLDILAGIPTVLDATAEAFVPQMTNLELLNGVSFTKGCYTGQEIVARTHYLGKIKRRMYRARIDSTEPPAAGAELYAPAAGEQAIGKLVDSIAHPQGGYAALVVLVSEHAQDNAVRIGALDGPVVRLEALPYELPA